MMQFLKIIFHISVLILIIISLYPGSLLGFFIYGDLTKQPVLFNNPFETTINHFLAHLYVSFLGFFIYMKKSSFNRAFYGLLFLASALEVFQLVVPNRSFEFNDLVANILGLFVAYLIIKIYLLFNKS